MRHVPSTLRALPLARDKASPKREGWAQRLSLSLSRARAKPGPRERERQAQQTHDTAEEGARALCRHGIESRRRYSLVVCPLLHLAVLVAVCTLCVADELPTRSLLQFSSS